MGALFSSLLDIFTGDSNWIENGFRKGYFPLRKQWEMADVEQAKQILLPLAQEEGNNNSSTVVRISSLSLVGQYFVKEKVLEELLKLLVSRPELEILRLSGSAPWTDLLLDAAVMANKLRVERYLEDDDTVASHWRQLTELPTTNALVLRN